MATKRLFFGTFVDKTLFEGLLDEVKDSFNSILNGKWTDAHNLHFTYKFLGNVDEDKIPEITKHVSRSLNEIDSVLKIAGIGTFPLNNKPQMVFAKIFNPDKSIFYHFNNIESSMVKLGFPKERRKFFPHISLIRVKEVNGDYAELLQSYQDLQFGCMKNYRVNLIESKLTQAGPIYNIIA